MTQRAEAGPLAQCGVQALTCVRTSSSSRVISPNVDTTALRGRACERRRADVQARTSADMRASKGARASESCALYDVKISSLLF